MLLGMLGVVSWFAPPLAGAWACQKFLTKENGLRAGIKQVLLWLFWVNTAAFVVTYYLFQYRAGIWQSLCTLPSFALKYAAVGVAVTGASLAVLAVYPRLTGRLPDLPALPARARLPLCIAVCAGFWIMHFPRIFEENLWSDEAFSVLISRESFWKMLVTTGGSDMHPPLYPACNILVNRLTGGAVWAYHLLPLLLYGATLVLAIVWLRRHYGTVACLVFATMLSLLPQGVRYAVEIRMYALAALCVCMSYAFLHNILERGRRSDFFWFAFFSLGAAFSHYYALVTVAAYYLVLLVLAMAGRLRWKPVLLTCAATVVVYLPWLIVLIATFVRVSGASDFWMVDIPLFRQCLEYIFTQEPFWAGGLFLGLFALLVTLALARGISLRAAEGKKRFAFSNQAIWALAGLLAMALTIFAGQLISRLFHPMFITRYLYPASVALWMLMAALLGQLPFRRLAGAALVALLLVQQIPVFSALCREEQARNTAMLETLQQVQPAEDVVIVTNGVSLNHTMLSYYYPDNAHVYLDPELTLELDEDKSYMLLLVEPITQEQLQWLDSQGLACDGEPYEGWIATEPAYAYTLRPAGQE